jgi:SNF2 family DNA or RNA helicase
MAIKKTFGHIIFNKEHNEWVIKKLDPDATIQLKKMFTKIGLTSKAPFRFKNTLDMCADLEWFTYRYPLEMSDDDLNILKLRKHQYVQRNNSFEEILSNDYKAREIKLKKGFSLRNYQAQAVELTYKNKFLFLGDQLGLGKTVSGIGLLVQKRTLPAIIVVPTHLMEHWHEKINLFTNLKVHKIQGRKPYKLPPYDVFIIKYSCLAGWFDVFQKLNYKTVIYDEIHYLRRCESDRYRAAEELSSYSNFKLGLSATPIFNYGHEIFNILDILNEGCLGFKWDFLREWTTDNKRVKDPKALGVYLRNNFMFLRRMPEDVGRELPSINKIVQNVDFDKRTIQDAEKLMEQLALRVLNASFTEKGQAARELDRLARKHTGLAKAKAVAEYVKILLDNERPVLLAGWHRDVYEIWEEELADYNPLFYTGSESPKRKHENAQAFQRGDSNLMIISLASGEGLDGLQYRCKDIVIGELDWSPAKHDQLIGRLHRDGQDDVVTAHFLVSDAGSDPFIIDLLGVKASQATDIIDPTAPVKEVVSDNKRMVEFAKNLLKK